MTVFDLEAEQTAATGTVAGITLGRDGDEDESLYCDLTVEVGIETEDDAAVVDRTVPGALDHWRRSAASRDAADAATAVDGAAAGQVAARGRHATSRVRDTDPAEYTVTVLDEERETVLTRKGVARSVGLTATPKAGVVLATRFRLRDVAGAEVGALADCFDRAVHVELTRVQKLLAFPSRPAARVGDVAVFHDGTEERAGLVVGRSEDGDTLDVDDFGATYQVAAQAVTSAVGFVPPQGYDMASRQKHYARRSKAGGVRASWVWLVHAAGHATAQGTATHIGDAVVLDTALCDAAVSLAVASAPGQAALA